MDGFSEFSRHKRSVFTVKGLMRAASFWLSHQKPIKKVRQMGPFAIGIHFTIPHHHSTGMTLFLCFACPYIWAMNWTAASLNIAPKKIQQSPGWFLHSPNSWTIQFKNLLLDFCDYSKFRWNEVVITCKGQLSLIVVQSWWKLWYLLLIMSCLI